MTSAERMRWVDAAKGIGIVLVVLGHYYPKDSPVYWEHARSIVYSFHMPLFFILSGFLFDDGKYDYWQMLAVKARRLLIPYLTVALAFLMVKLSVGPYVRLEEPVTSESAFNVIIDPVDSYAPLLWFLQALFLIFALYPLFRRWLRAPLIVVVFIAINELFGNRYPLLGRAVANMPFFALGVALRNAEPFVLSQIRTVGLTIVAFALGCVFQMTATHEVMRDYLVQFTLAIVGSLAVIALSQRFEACCPKIRSALNFLGLYSMTIYLLHPIFESATRIVLGTYPARYGLELPFLATALASAWVGVLAPICVEKFFIRRSSSARRLILGSR